MQHPDIKLTELVDLADASIRLRHVIHAISESALTGFDRVSDYINNRVENEAKLRSWRGFGQKSMDEFNLILKTYTSDTQAFVDKWKLTLESNGFPSVDHKDHDLSSTASTANNEQSFIDKWKIALESNSLKHIQLKNPDLLLTELVKTANSSVRLRHAIQAICEGVNPPFTTVGEYVSKRISNEAKLKGQLNVGKTTIKEFNDLIDLFITSEEACIEKWHANQKWGDEGLDFYKSTLEKLTSDCAEINKRFPGTFEKLTIAANSLSTEDYDLPEKLTQLSKVAKGILKDPKRAKMMEMRVQGASLEEAAKESGLTRERVRQIEQPLKPYLTDITTIDWAKSKLNLAPSVQMGHMPSDQELDSIHPCLKSAVKIHFVDPDGSFRPTTRPLTPKDKQKIANSLGLKLDADTESILRKRWTVERAIEEIRELAKDLGTPHLMPKQHEQVAAGKTGLRGVISRLGGQAKFAKLAGLEYQGQLVNEDGSRTYWTDERIISALHEVASKNGHPGVMPTQQECRDAYPENNSIVASLTQSSSLTNERTRSWLELAELAGLRLEREGHRKTLGFIKSFVQSLGDALDFLTPAEVFVLFEQQNITKTGDNRHRSRSFDNLVEAIQSGYLPASVVKEWANGIDSDVIDNLLDPDIKTVADAFSGAGLKIPKKKRLTKDNDSNDVIEDVEQHLPVPSNLDTLKALDKATTLLQRTSSDEEAVHFLVAKAASKLWARCFDDEQSAIKETQTHSGNLYSTEAKEKFLREYESSKSLILPAGYDFRDNDGQRIEPKLMQRLIAYKLLNDRRVLNLSGTGTGKTLSAVLASRVVGAKLTVITCPNATVPGWAKTIKNAYPESEVITKTLEPVWQTNLPHYLVVNHEIFQDRNESILKHFIQTNIVDLIVIDELHQVKQRDEKFESQRRRLMAGLITDIPTYRDKPRVLGMSATPVINNLFEGKSLIELVSGVEHTDVGSDVSIENCMRLYQKFTTMGFRMLPRVAVERMPRITEIDASNSIPALISLGKGAHPQQIEAILIRERWPSIKAALRKKTVIFTDYVKDIVPYLMEETRKAGFSVGAFTGNDKEATDLGFNDMLDQFIRGNLDVLVASIKTAGTGVDGLQHICNNVIFATLPWTCTDYEQAVGRFDREGVKFNSLDIHIPKTFAYLDNGERWSWCESKLARIENKRDIAKAAVDGEIPDTQSQLTPQQATKYWMNWLDRLNEHGVSSIERYEIKVPLKDSSPAEAKKRQKKYGDYAAMTTRWGKASSTDTHERLSQNPEEWCYYHTRMREAEPDWQFIPRSSCVEHLKTNLPPGSNVGDFGAGEAGLAKLLAGLHNVYSFDHIAINDSVTQCDMANTGLEPSVLDAAVFSLSLLGSNIKDYIQEAYRTLKPGGQLIIWHKKAGADLEKFVTNLAQLGFAVVQKETRSDFFFVWAIKEGVQKDSSKELSF